VALTPKAIKVYLAIFSCILNSTTNHPPFTRSSSLSKKVITPIAFWSMATRWKILRSYKTMIKLNVICINGRVHKAGRQEYVAPLVAGQNGNIYSIVPDFPEVKREMQKNY
jgi:hypothetical protein